MTQSYRGALFFGGVAALVSACGGDVEVAAAGYTSPASCEVHPQWERTVPGVGFQAALAHNGGYVVAGAAEDPSGIPTAVLSVDSLGSSRWEQTLSQRLGKLFPYGSGFVVSGSVGFYADISITALSADGAPLWDSVVGTGEYDDEFAEAVLMDGDSTVIVGTTGHYPASGGQILVARLDAGGGVEWVRVFGEDYQDGSWAPDERPFGAYLDAKGRVVVGAQRWLEGGGGPAWIFAVTREGDIAWELVDEVAYDRPTEWALLPTSDGGSVIAGTIPNGNTRGPARVLRLDAEGGVVWARSIDDGSGRQEVVEAALEAPNGELVLAGYSANSAEARVWWLTPDGAVRQTRDYPDAEGPLAILRPMPGGGYLLASNEIPYEEKLGAWHLLRISSEGDLLWKHDVTGQGLGWLGGVVTGEGGEVFASGRFTLDDYDEGRMVLLDERCGASP